MVLIAGSQAQALSEELYWKEYGIEIRKLPADKLATLENTIKFIGDIKPGELKVGGGIYASLSMFRELYGFDLDGTKLKDWLLRRMKSVKNENSWTIAINRNKGHFLLGDMFFERSDMLERVYCLIHEARHSDGNGYDHVICPKGFPYISAGSPDINLQKVKACDRNLDGAYGFQSALLFEFFAYGIFPQREAGLIYNSSLTRIVDISRGR